GRGDQGDARRAPLGPPSTARSRPWQTLHDHAPQPIFERVDRRRLDVLVEPERGAFPPQVGPGNSVGHAPARPESRISARVPTTKTAVEARKQSDRADLDVRHDRRLPIAEQQDDPIHAPGVRAVAVPQLLVEHVRHQMKAHDPNTSNGIDTTASTSAMTLMHNTTALPMRPFVFLPRSSLSFMRMRNGSTPTGSDAAPGEARADDAQARVAPAGARVVARLETRPPFPSAPLRHEIGQREGD